MALAAQLPLTARAAVRPRAPHRCAALQQTAQTSEVSNRIVVKRGLSQQELEMMGVYKWPTWGCEVSKFPWTYDDAETFYVLRGRVTITAAGGGAPVTVGAGDLASCPAGMSCTWEVHESIFKHYSFDAKPM